MTDRDSAWVESPLGTDRWHCRICPDTLDDVPDILNHVRLMHPDVWGNGPECWPDGRVVIHSESLLDWEDLT